MDAEGGNHELRFKSLSVIHFTSWFSSQICAEWEKDTWLILKSGFGELLGTRRNVYVIVHAAKCMHATAI